MRQVLCGLCKRSIPMNNAFTLNGVSACRSCCENAQEKATSDEPVHISGQVDPTICRRCQGDNGDLPLPTIAGMPVCQTCSDVMRHFPFPAWIRAAALGLILLVVGASIWNLRFVLAYREMNASVRALERGDWDHANAMARSAVRRVPESPDLVALTSYFDGIADLRENRFPEALANFKRAGERLPAGFGIDELTQQARIGAAFEAQNYGEALSLSIQAADRQPNDAGAQAAVASALACQFAATGDVAFRERALSRLKVVKNLATEMPAWNVFEQRMLHRLSSREIIDENEFHRRFPQGWPAGKESQP